MKTNKNEYILLGFFVLFGIIFITIGIFLSYRKVHLAIRLANNSSQPKKLALKKVSAFKTNQNIINYYYSLYS